MFSGQGRPVRCSLASSGDALQPLRPALALVPILIVAGLLRFVGLSWGLRHVPDWDERAFVANVWEMLARHDLDHRFYEYPGLFPYLLALVLAPLRTDGPAGPAAYLAARGLVASFGVASVALVQILGTKVQGPRVGLFAALLLAVSPIEVDAAHMVRPDVVLESFVLMALLAFRRVGPEVRGDAWSGVALGAATAVKFTGAFLVPSYLVARWWAAGPRLRRTVLVAALSAVVLIAFTPYAVLRFQSYTAGVRTQWLAHYHSPNVAPNLLGHAAYYGEVVVRSLGPLGSVLLLGGLWLSAREWRRHLFLLAHPVVTIAVLSTAELRFSRHLVPTLGVLALLAAFALEEVARWRPIAGWLLAGAAALFPLRSSVEYVRNVTHPSTWDQALDWTQSNIPLGARILSAVPDLGLDRKRHEIVVASGAEEADRVLARSVDYVVAPDPKFGPASGWAPARVFTPDTPASGPATALFAVPPLARPLYRDVALEPGRLRASANPDMLPALVDDSIETFWQTAEPQRPGDFVEVTLPQPVLLARVELVLGYRPLQQALRYGRGLDLVVTEDGVSWHRVRTVDGRPPVEEQLEAGRAPSQVLLLIQPLAVRGVRVVQTARDKRRWGFSAFRLQAVVAP